MSLKQKLEKRVANVKDRYEKRIIELEQQNADLERAAAEAERVAKQEYNDLLDRNIALERELEELEESLNKATL